MWTSALAKEDQGVGMEPEVTVSSCPLIALNLIPPSMTWKYFKHECAQGHSDEAGGGPVGGIMSQYSMEND